MTELLGPANGRNTQTSRPAEARTFGSADRWFKDCTSFIAQDGTDISASILNQLTAFLRGVARGAGNRLDGTTPVVPESNANDGLLTDAIKQVVQRGLTNYVPSSGVTGTASAIALDLTPNVIEYKAGLRIIFPAGATATGATTVNCDTLGAVTLKKRGAAAIQAGDWSTGDLLEICFDGTFFQWVNVFPQSGTPSTEANDVHVADLEGTTPQVDMADLGVLMRHLTMVRGGGVVSVNASGGIAWSGTFIARGMGARFGLMGANDDQPINQPADGTTIATLPGGAIAPAGGFIPLIAGEALYYVPFIVGATSTWGTFRSVRDGAACRVPFHWIAVAWRSHAGNEIGFANGLTIMVPSSGTRSYDTTLFDSYRVPVARDCERNIVAGSGVLIDGGKGSYPWTGDRTVSVEAGATGVKIIASWRATHPGNSNTGVGLGCTVTPPPGGVNTGLWTVTFNTVQPDNNYYLQGASRMIFGDASSPSVYTMAMGQDTAYGGFAAIDGYDERTKAVDAMTFYMGNAAAYGVTPPPVWFNILRAG